MTPSPKRKFFPRQNASRFTKKPAPR
jgi:hypothetical protein